MKYSIQTQDVKLLPSILESNLHTDLYVIYASDFTEIKHKRPNDAPDNSFSITYTCFITFPFLNCPNRHLGGKSWGTTFQNIT